MINYLIAQFLSIFLTGNQYIGSPVKILSIKPIIASTRTLSRVIAVAKYKAAIILLCIKKIINVIDQIYLNIFITTSAQSLENGPIKFPLKAHTIMLISVKNKKPKRNTQIPTYIAGIKPYVIRTINIMTRVNLLRYLIKSIMASAFDGKITNFFELCKGKI